MSGSLHGLNFFLTADDLEHYKDQGYVIKRGLLPAAHVAELKADLERFLDQAQTTGQPAFRWINKEKRIPARIGQMLRADYVMPSYVDSIENGPYLPVAQQVLGEPVRYSLFGMLAGGDGNPYIQAWHRDLAPVEGEREMHVLEAGYRTFIQINAPLLPDRFLQIVPGSHLRPTTDAEREVLKTKPDGDMPGQLTVELQPGDVAFYYSNLLHRGYNPDGAMRWTMHHAFLKKSAPVFTHETGQEWITTPDYKSYLNTTSQKFHSFMQGYIDALSAGQPISFHDV